MEVQEHLTNFIVKEFLHEKNNAAVEIDTPLIEEGIIDSMGLVKLIKFIEGTFGISIDEDEVEINNFRDIDSITDFLAKKIK